jgi:hypothetical protein
VARSERLSIRMLVFDEGESFYWEGVGARGNHRPLRGAGGGDGFGVEQNVGETERCSAWVIRSLMRMRSVYGGPAELDGADQVALMDVGELGAGVRGWGVWRAGGLSL